MSLIWSRGILSAAANLGISVPTSVSPPKNSVATEFTVGPPGPSPLSNPFGNTPGVDCPGLAPPVALSDPLGGSAGDRGGLSAVRLIPRLRPTRLARKLGLPRGRQHLRDRLGALGRQELRHQRCIVRGPLDRRLQPFGARHLAALELVLDALLILPGNCGDHLEQRARHVGRAVTRNVGDVDLIVLGAHGSLPLSRMSSSRSPPRLLMKLSRSA